MNILIESNRIIESIRTLLRPRLYVYRKVLLYNRLIVESNRVLLGFACSYRLAILIESIRSSFLLETLKTIGRFSSTIRYII